MQSKANSAKGTARLSVSAISELSSYEGPFRGHVGYWLPRAAQITGQKTTSPKSPILWPIKHIQSVKLTKSSQDPLTSDNVLL
jgi:hypothetical protein